MEGYGIDVNQKKWVGESPDPEKQRFINPRAMQSFLIQQSNHHNNVYKSK